MSEVQFNEPPVTLKALPRPRGITAFVIAKGFVKDEREATTLLAGIAVVALILTAFLWWSGFASGQQSGITPQERARIDAMP